MTKQTNKAATTAKTATTATNLVSRNVARILAVQQQRATNNANRAATALHAAGMLQLQQICAQYNLPLPRTANAANNARANSATMTPSVDMLMIQGKQYRPCKAVHALCETLPADATRKEQMQLCLDNGINRATASTQIAVYRKALQAEIAAYITTH